MRKGLVVVGILGAALAASAVALAVNERARDFASDTALDLTGQPATPDRVFRKMQRAACAGDAAAFFSHVNKTALRASWVEATLAAPAVQQNAMSDSLKRDLVESIAGPGFDKKMHEWEDDIATRSASKWCNTKYYSTDLNVVLWHKASGDLEQGIFERRGDTFLLEGFKP